MGSIITPIKRTTPKQINNSLIIKKGSNDGKTIPHHISNPVNEDSNAAFGYIIIEKAKSVVKIAIIRFFVCERYNRKPPLE